MFRLLALVSTWWERKGWLDWYTSVWLRPCMTAAGDWWDESPDRTCRENNILKHHPIIKSTLKCELLNEKWQTMNATLAFKFRPYSKLSQSFCTQEWVKLCIHNIRYRDISSRSSCNTWKWQIFWCSRSKNKKPAFDQQFVPAVCTLYTFINKPPGPDVGICRAPSITDLSVIDSWLSYSSLNAILADIQLGLFCGSCNISASLAS